MKRVKWFVLAAVLIQVLPYGRSHENPPVVEEPKWDSPASRALFRRACFDCHSNQTVWPWYANVAPVSWLVQNDVDGGREHLNFSEWNRPQSHAKDVADEVLHRDMPLAIYLWLHPEAKLSDADIQALIAAAEKTFGPQSSDKEKTKLFQ